jgi:hypothetical protein
MTTLLPAPGPEYQERVEGTWGEFATASGRVAYIMTNARLGVTGTDLEHRLTRQLRPVREVLGIADLEFDQLLQRDLDDHRVATELVPYLLRTTAVGPAFFPPILAILLPFDANTPSRFPDLTVTEEVLDNQMPFKEERFGDAFRVRRLYDPGSGLLSSIRFGSLSWNDEVAKVVVLDGQHRAMALLAIDRTLNNGWEDAGRGARYRHFYEHGVRAALGGGEVALLDEVRIPVTVCWLPDLTGETSEPHIAARKLFVDVNKTAKAPSPDRVVLLSDSDLLNIFTRALLNTLRGQQSDPPLAAIEYDNPTGRAGPPTRWSAISTLQALLGMVERTVFGPRKYVTQVDAAIRGRRPSDMESDLFLREQLAVASLTQAHIPDGVGQFAREDIGRFDFPRSAVPALTQGFLDGWGAGLLHLLGHVHPYKAHYDALSQLDATWQPADASAIDALAREAIFDGVGMYWILLRSFRHWQAAEGEDVSVPDVVQAWTRLSTWRDEFRRMRAEQYLGTSSPPDVAAADSLYAVLSTQACQVGLALTLATLCHKAAASGTRVLDVARAVTSSLNVAFVSARPIGGDRRLSLSQTIEDPLNRIADMNATRSVEFRYLWLELLCTPEAASHLGEAVPDLDPDVVRDLRDQARTRYAQQLIDERIRERLRLNRTLSRASVQVPVTIEVTSSMRAALASWFGVDDQEFERWAAEADFEVQDDEAELEDPSAIE